MPAVTVARAPRQGLRAAGPSHTVSVPQRLKCPTQPAVALEAGFKPVCCARATVKRAMAGLLAASACLVLDVQGLHAAEVTQLFNSSCAGALLLKLLRAAHAEACKTTLHGYVIALCAGLPRLPRWGRQRGAGRRVAVPARPGQERRSLTRGHLQSYL